MLREVERLGYETVAGSAYISEASQPSVSSTPSEARSRATSPAPRRPRRRNVDSTTHRRNDPDIQGEVMRRQKTLDSWPAYPVHAESMLVSHPIAAYNDPSGVFECTVSSLDQPTQAGVLGTTMTSLSQTSAANEIT